MKQQAQLGTERGMVSREAIKLIGMLITDLARTVKVLNADVAAGEKRRHADDPVAMRMLDTRRHNLMRPLPPAGPSRVHREDTFAGICRTGQFSASSRARRTLTTNPAWAANLAEGVCHSRKPGRTDGQITWAIYRPLCPAPSRKNILIFRKRKSLLYPPPSRPTESRAVPGKITHMRRPTDRERILVSACSD